MLSTLDLVKGFYQVGMHPDSRDMTTFCTPFGKFLFRRMPFGLKNAPATFQHLMKKVLSSCRQCAVVYIYDILVFSPNWKAHLRDLDLVLDALEKASLTGKLTKCQGENVFWTF